MYLHRTSNPAVIASLAACPQKGARAKGHSNVRISVGRWGTCDPMLLPHISPLTWYQLSPKMYVSSKLKETLFRVGLKWSPGRLMIYHKKNAYFRESRKHKVPFGATFVGKNDETKGGAVRTFGGLHLLCKRRLRD